MMSVVRVLLLILIAFVFSSCTGVRGGTYYRGGYGPGPYWGWGYDRTIIIDRYPDIDDIDDIVVPMPEPSPDMGMPDFGGGMDMDMGGMDMGGMDF